MSLRNKHIFIVEDNVFNRVTYQILMAHEGANVHFERVGHGAIDQIKNRKHLDLIILDLMLTQGESGYQVFKAIRQLPQFENVPIVAVSAAEPSAAMAHCRELGFSGFIPKPINEQLFPHQLCQIMNGEEIWAFH